MRILKAAVAVALLGGLAACAEPYQQRGYGYGYGQPAPSAVNNPAVRTLGGAAAGAVIADATGGSRTQGALIGAVAGGVSCGVPGLPRCN